MELKDIAVISGKGGLYKVLKPTRTGVIVESIDEKKTRFPVSSSNRISVLEEISLYTKTTEGSTPLKVILRKIYDEFKEDPGVTPGSEGDELRAFIQHIEPEYDEEKVYTSDIKKIVSWYFIILKNFPEILTEREDETKAEEQTDEVEVTQEDAAIEKKPKVKSEKKGTTGAKEVGTKSKAKPKTK